MCCGHGCPQKCTVVDKHRPSIPQEEQHNLLLRGLIASMAPLAIGNWRSVEKRVRSNGAGGNGGSGQPGISSWDRLPNPAPTDKAISAGH